MCACGCQLAYAFLQNTHTNTHTHTRVHPTHIGGLSDEPLLCVEDVFDASDQLQRTAVIRALKDKDRMCCVKAC